MLEITGKNISDLDDVSLRTLVTKLCEAELRGAGLPVSGLTAGGDQNAADGGLDVRVSLIPHDGKTDFIPRPSTGFQVKEPDMPRKEILKEMCPNGELRPVIQELAKAHGAYVIVSSHGSTSDKSLQNRIAAMREATSTVPGIGDIHLDFYDRERLATWARQYPGISAWVREQLGARSCGWQSYKHWSANPEYIKAEYISDTKGRLYDAQGSLGRGLTIQEGINRIRGILAEPTKTIRLIGLSGVGKTRLVEALFDDTVGENPLDPALVVYTDISDNPTPSPRDLISHLIQSRQRAIVVVDNCPPDTHRALVRINNDPSSTVSILTVEYDVGEDEPEGTDVYRLEPASEDVIEQLIAKVTPHISQVDRHRISEFAGGNARIALALVRTVHRNDSLAKLTDEDLFQRLFRQRRSEDPTLLRTGEACSLVYSFEGETSEGEQAELPALASLAGISVDELFRNIQELKDRQLVQQRGKWRAVLPQAIANRLAQRALERILPATISAILVDVSSERLLKSFSRRLGYLHHCKAAQKRAEEWLAAGGMLGRIEKLSPLGLTILHNIAPVTPMSTLNAIERALDDHHDINITDIKNIYRQRIASLLTSLAFDEELFERAALLLSRFVIMEEPNNNRNSARSLFNGLFQLYLSGTHATVKQRLQIINQLLNADNKRSQDVGLAALDQMLKTWNFLSHNHFEFGARPRDYGFHPTTQGEITNWYREVLSFILEIFVQKSPLADQLSSIIAANFHGLWVKAGMHGELAQVATTFSERGCWANGWINVRKTIKLEASKMPEAAFKDINSIEAILRPRTLLDQARAYVLSPQWGDFEIADGEHCDDANDLLGGYKKADKKAEELGQELAVHPELLSKILPELIQNHEGGRIWLFGSGLGTTAPDLNEMWQTLKAAFASAPEPTRSPAVLRGFLNGASRKSWEKTSAFLDDAVSDDTLGEIFPYLQCSVDIDNLGIQRLLESLRKRLAPAGQYLNLSAGKATDPIPPNELRLFLSTLATMPEGADVAIEILYMKFFSLRSDGLPVADELIHCGRKLLLRHDFEDTNDKKAYRVTEILRECLRDQKNEVFAQEMCTKLANDISNYRTSFYSCLKIITELLKSAPKIALSTFLLSKSKQAPWRHSSDLWSSEAHPLEQVPLGVLIDWANEEPQIRFPALASVTQLFTNSEAEKSETISSVALGIIDAAPTKEDVLKNMEQQLRLPEWSGSLATALTQRRAALAQLKVHPDPVVAKWASKWDRNLDQQAAQERSRERDEDERFE